MKGVGQLVRKVTLIKKNTKPIFVLKEGRKPLAAKSQLPI